ncbi:MAG: DUF4249 domain-containing protein [Bacteroidota bacterium]
MGLIACSDEEITWDVEHSTEMLVVEGSFTSEKKKHRIILSKTVDYFLNEGTPRISGADVTVSDGSTTYEFEELKEKKGIYESERKVAGRAGHTYTLNIHLQAPINNKTHYQASEEMIEGIDLESMEAVIYRNPIYQEGFPTDSLLLFVALYGHDPDNIDNLYRVDLYRNGELMQDTVDEEKIYSDSEQSDDNEYIHNLTFLEEFQPGDAAAIKISTVTKSYQQFIEGIQNIADQSGNPFDLSGPPANAVGNIEGGDALGYFRVSYVSWAQSIVMDGREEKEIDDGLISGSNR